MNVYLENLGCDSNEADTARLRSFFEKNGHGFSPAEDADVQVLMSCGFNQDKIKENEERLRALRKNKGKVILGGCLSKILPKSKALADEAFGPREWERVDELFGGEIGIEECAPSFLRNKSRVIRIATGCRGACSYCAIRKATGSVRSRSLDAIKEDLKEGLRAGVEQFVLVGEDVGAYGQDVGKDFAWLLKELTSMRGRFTITVTTVHPEWFLKIPGLYSCFSHPKIDKKIYVPNQAATNRLLSLMKRNYTVQEYKDVIKRLRAANPEILIQSDFLIGFPTETEYDVAEAKRLIDELDFYFLQVFRYTDMEKTIAHGLSPKVSEEEGLRRTRDVIDHFIKKNEADVGKRLLVNTNIGVG